MQTAIHAVTEVYVSCKVSCHSLSWKKAHCFVLVLHNQSQSLASCHDTLTCCAQSQGALVNHTCRNVCAAAASAGALDLQCTLHTMVNEYYAAERRTTCIIIIVMLGLLGLLGLLSNCRACKCMQAPAEHDGVWLRLVIRNESRVCTAA